MAKAVPLAVAAASLVARSGRIALKRRVRIIPYVAGSDVIRQTKMNPTLIPISRDQICDAPIGPARTRKVLPRRQSQRRFAAPDRRRKRI